jgi:hypothetical protein
MPLRVIEEEGEVKVRVDDLKTIHTVLELDGHVVVCPISLIVGTQLKVDNKW